MVKKNQEILANKYRPKKINNLKIYEFIKHKLSDSGKELFLDCSTFNQFITTSDKQNIKLVNSNKCGGGRRFCPICSWKQSKKDAMKISVVLEAIKTELEKEFIFLTLTTPNIKGEYLKSEVTKFNKSFSKMFKRENIKISIKGYIRKLEITYDKERFITTEMYTRKKDYYKARNLNVGDKNPTYDTYNPHFHVLLCVNKSYFNDRDYYISHRNWLEMWQEATNMPEITQVNIQKVYSNLGKEVSEIAKYSAKDYEIATSQDVFDIFYESLKGRRLIVYGGLLKDYARKYKDGELDKYKEQDKNEYFYKLVALWNKSLKKFTKEYKELEDWEKERFNGHLLNEIDME